MELYVDHPQTIFLAEVPGGCPCHLVVAARAPGGALPKHDVMTLVHPIDGSLGKAQHCHFVHRLERYDHVLQGEVLAPLENKHTLAGNATLDGENKLIKDTS